jgi:hypothetical protein
MSPFFDQRHDLVEKLAALLVVWDGDFIMKDGSLGQVNGKNLEKNTNSQQQSEGALCQRTCSNGRSPPPHFSSGTQVARIKAADGCLTMPIIGPVCHVNPQASLAGTPGVGRLCQSTVAATGLLQALLTCGGAILMLPQQRP